MLLVYACTNMVNNSYHVMTVAKFGFAQSEKIWFEFIEKLSELSISDALKRWKVTMNQFIKNDRKKSTYDYKHVLLKS